MTVYFVTSQPSGVTIQAGSNDIRIIGAELTEISGSPSNGYFYVAAPGAATASGGSLQTPWAAKSGAPASTATARVAGATMSGAFRLCGAYVVASSTSGSGAVSAVAVWKPMGDLVLPSGGIFRQFGGAYEVVIWYEETRLSWSY